MWLRSKMNSISQKADWREAGIQTKITFCNWYKDNQKSNWTTNGIVLRDKAILDAKGYHQEAVSDIKAPVTRLENVRTYLAHAAHSNFNIYQVNVNKCTPGWWVKRGGQCTSVPGLYSYRSIGTLYISSSQAHYRLVWINSILKQSSKTWYDTLTERLLEHEVLESS